SSDDLLLVLPLFVFFFQAEDGIRDATVTGVQTCALPILEDFFRRRSRVMPPNNRKQAMLPTTAEIIDNPIGTACGFAVDIGHAQIGRASCRERVYISGVAVGVNKNN